MLTTDIKYAVGIDFGHGETSFSYYNITWGKDITNQNLTQNTVIYLQDGAKTIPSIYLYNRHTDQMFIGETAGINYEQIIGDFINYGQITGDLSNYIYGVSFKKPISHMSEEEKFLFKRYMIEVKKVLMCCSPVNLMDGDRERQIKANYIVIIAKPSGWSKEEDSLYLNLAEEAGLPVLGIWPESRASIMRFISKDDPTSVANGEALSIDDINMIHDGCVLMDIGSSTTDFSYVNKHMNYPIDDNGNDCGGQIIDEILLQYVLNLSCNANVRKDISESPNDLLYNSLLFEIRKAKESLFSGPVRPGLRVRADYDSPNLSGKQEVKCLYRDCPLDTIIKLLNEGLSAFNITPVGSRFDIDGNTYPELVKNAIRNGFIPALHNELCRFITNHIISDNNHIINCFILTGGTSKLFKVLGIDTYFKSNILPEEYHECKVYMDTDPSTSVSDGLALLGRNYALFKGCPNIDNDLSLNLSEIEKAKGLKNQLDILVNKIFKNISADSVKEAIAREIRDKVMTKSSSTVERFAGYCVDNPSLDDLKKNLTIAISSACSDSGQIISRQILQCLKSTLDEEKLEIEKLVCRYTVQEVNIPSTEKYSSMSDININVNVPELIYSVSSKLTEEVVVGILYIMLFPIATVIWAAIRVVDFFTDEPSISFGEFFKNFIEGIDGPMNWVATRGRLRAERKNILTKFNDKKVDISYNTYVKILEKLSGIDDIVNQGIKEIVESYKEDTYKVIERVFK